VGRIEIESDSARWFKSGAGTVLSRRQRCKRGFTITEMLIVVAVVGVIIAVAAPNLSSLYINNRLDTAANELIATLNFARSEAIRRGTTVSVESAAGRTDPNWTSGWKVFVVSSGEVLRFGQPQQHPVRLFNVSDTSLQVGYVSNGSRDELVTFVFVLCYDGALTGAGPKSRSRGVLVNPSGAVSLAAIGSDGRPLKPAKPLDGFVLTPILSCEPI